MTGKKWTLYKTLYLPQFIPPLIEVEIFCSCKVRKILYFQSQYCCHKLSNLKIKKARILYRPPKVRPKNLTIGGRYFYG